jgi:hypothetical protein
MPTGNLMENDDILTAALQIHSVEARHARQRFAVSAAKPFFQKFTTSRISPSK